MIPSAHLTTLPATHREQEFQFYPTDANLVTRLVLPYKYKGGLTLEPSAGRGDILEGLSEFNTRSSFRLYCCEIAADLRAILQDKGYKVIGSDFLTLDAPYRFDLIVMNPPFHNAATHVLKAWDMLVPSGECAAILPANAIGKQGGDWTALNKLIEQYGDPVEQCGSAFSGADRKTNAQIVIIRLKKPAEAAFDPFAGYVPAEDNAYIPPEDRDLPADRNLIRAIVAQYDATIRALKNTQDAELIFRKHAPAKVLQYENLKPFHERVDKVKEAYWDLIFDRTGIGDATTSGYREKFMRQRATLSLMQFTEETIYEVLHRFMANREAIMEQCVLDMFRHVTRYSQWNANSNEQWKTNKDWKINPKIIVPGALNYYGSWSLDYLYRDFLNDMDKVIGMFSGIDSNGVCSASAIENVLGRIRKGEDSTQKFDSPNFQFRVFMKGTIHLWFKDIKTLEMINRYAAEHQINALGAGK